MNLDRSERKQLRKFSIWGIKSLGCAPGSASDSGDTENPSKSEMGVNELLLVRLLSRNLNWRPDGLPIAFSIHSRYLNNITKFPKMLVTALYKRLGSFIIYRHTWLPITFFSTESFLK